MPFSFKPIRYRLYRVKIVASTGINMNGLVVTAFTFFWLFKVITFLNFFDTFWTFGTATVKMNLNPKKINTIDGSWWCWIPSHQHAAQVRYQTGEF